jgi:hypothetical protein
METKITEARVWAVQSIGQEAKIESMALLTSTMRYVRWHEGAGNERHDRTGSLALHNVLLELKEQARE